MDSAAPAWPPFLGEAPASFSRARVVVLPVPYEATVSYGRGTAGGPRAILAASSQVELWDEELECEPHRCGVWTAPPLALEGLEPQEVVEAVQQSWDELLAAGKWVLMLGGEHSITPGAVAAAARRQPGLVVVQLDAHADLRDEYEGRRWSHACAMARSLEHAPVRAIGIRSLSEPESRRIRAGAEDYRWLRGVELEREGWIDRALAGLDDRPVYLTVDVDYFDPSLVPATGTPEPGGGRWWPTLELLEALFARTRVVGADLVELAPQPGTHHSDFTVARLAAKLVGLAFRGLPAGSPAEP